MSELADHLIHNTGKEVWDKIWSHDVSYQWDALSQCVLEVITANVGDVLNLRILEAGSGTGKVPLRLAQMGALVTLVDYSDIALNNSRQAFEDHRCRGDFVLSDIRAIPAADNTYDVTWNAGVLEHFDEKEQVKMIKEMARITRPGGSVIVLTPNANCLLYRIGKFYAEMTNNWPYGYEGPLQSLREEFAASGVVCTDEYNVGFLNSLDFLDFIPGSGPIKEWAARWYRSLPIEEQKLFPGYLLATVGRVE